MNDQTPRRLSGSLLERAARMYDLTPPHTPQVPIDVAPSRPAAPTVKPVVAPVEVAPAEPVFAPVEMPRGNLLRPDQAMPEPESAPADMGGAGIFHAAAPAPTPIVAPLILPERQRIVIDRDLLAQRGMLVPGAPVTALAEEFRLVKRQLLQTSRTIRDTDADKARMVLVCSAKPDDGKTFCAINLALSMAAEKDVEILLVDADFAKPDILAQLGATEGPGLLDALTGNVASAEDCILDTDVPQLSVLPAGTRSNADTELLASERAHAVLDGLAAANPRRIVIFDSSPALAASPASVLASHVGQVMMVVRADRTSESDLRESVALLDGCEQIQLLLNGVSFQPGGRRFGSYGAYYGDAEK